MRGLAEFKPKLSSEVKVRFLKEDERGKFYIIGTTGESAFLKVHQVGKDVVDALDGHTSVAQIADDLRRKNVDIDLTRFISLLGQEGFIENYPHSRLRQKSREKLRIHYLPFLKNPERILGILHSLLSGLFKPALLMLFIPFNVFIVLYFASGVLIGSFRLQFFSLGESTFLAFALYFLLFFPFLGLMHELAHAVTCFHYGGKPSEIGMAVYLFTFFFYADTSDTWMFDKRKSILVFLAGPLITLFTGNVFFLLHLFFQSHPFTQVFVLIAFASYLSVLFGFNPLIEADGYYILQTLMDFPNIHLHAWSYASSWFRYRLGLISKREHEELTSSYSESERKMLAVYTPLAVLMNVLIVFIMLPWSILVLHEYVQLTSALVKAFPNFDVSMVAIWFFEGAYLFLVFVYSSFRIIKQAVRKLRVRRFVRGARMPTRC